MTLVPLPRFRVLEASLSSETIVLTVTGLRGVKRNKNLDGDNSVPSDSLGLRSSLVVIASATVGGPHIGGASRVARGSAITILFYASASYIAICRD